MTVQSGFGAKLDKLREIRAQSRQGGGPQRVAQQHQRGKLTARERVDLLFDPGTFEELDPFVTHRATQFGLAEQKVLGDAVVTGYGKVNGRPVFAYSQDFTVMGGSLSEAVGLKVCKAMDLAVKVGAPVVGVVDSGGARIQEGVDSLKGYGEVFFRNVRASGVVPQLSVIVGPAAGGGVYSPALTDFVFVVQGLTQMYITGPDVVKAVTGEDVTHEELGGALVHTARSGVAHFNAATEDECFALLRGVLSYLPSNNAEDPPREAPTDDPSRRCEELYAIVPEEVTRAYDIKEVIRRVVDNGEFLEVHAAYAPNVVVGFGRLDGHAVGIVANQPLHLAGVLDIDASAKAARFVRTCDAFNVPLVTFVDTPGYMPGVQQEHGGIIKHGSKLLFAYAEATVPKISVIVRKAYGGAYIVMSSKHLGGDINYAWPLGEVAVMGPEGAVSIVYREALRSSANPQETRAQLAQEYREAFANPYVAASRGFIDDVIDPADTRPKLVRALETLRSKRESLPPKRHGNIPL